MKKQKKKGAGRKPAPAAPARQLILPAWTVLLLFAVLGALLYSNTLQVPFVFDDEASIRDNTGIRWTSISPANLAAATRESPAPHRPLAYASFALNYMAHGYRLPGYHLVNIAVHILAGFLLFLLIRGTLALPLFLNRRLFIEPSEPRTQIPEVMAAIDARRKLKSQRRPVHKRTRLPQPRRKVIYDDFGEPLRKVWVDED